MAIYNGKTFENDVGEKLVIKSKKGIYLVMVWVDSDLHMLEFWVNENGRKVMMKTKTPSANVRAKKILMEMGSHYGWAANEDHNLVTELDAELDAIRAAREAPRDDGWVDNTLLDLDEEVVRSIVDYKGNPTNVIDHYKDSDGRQRICFFLKTVRSNGLAPPARYTKSDHGIRDFDEDSMVDEEETVSSEKVERFREEMDERFNQMANDIRTSQELMAKSFNAAVEAKMEGLLQQFFEQFKVHQPPRPVPDSHVSNTFTTLLPDWIML